MAVLSTSFQTTPVSIPTPSEADLEELVIIDELLLLPPLPPPMIQFELASPRLAPHQAPTSWVAPGDCVVDPDIPDTYYTTEAYRDKKRKKKEKKKKASSSKKEQVIMDVLSSPTTSFADAADIGSSSASTFDPELAIEEILLPSPCSMSSSGHRGSIFCNQQWINFVNLSEESQERMLSDW